MLTCFFKINLEFSYFKKRMHFSKSKGTTFKFPSRKSVGIHAFPLLETDYFSKPLALLPCIDLFIISAEIMGRRERGNNQ